MKTTYDWMKREDVQVCKEIARAIIKWDLAKTGEANAKIIACDVCRFMNYMFYDFRNDFDEWVEEEIRKQQLHKIKSR